MSSTTEEAQQDFIDIVIRMITSYDQKIQNDSPELSPLEFVKKNFCEKQLFVNNMQEKCVAIFFEICSLRRFLEEFTNDDLFPSTPAGLVHVYILIFYVSPSNVDDVIRSLTRHFDLEVIESAMKYFMRNDLMDLILEKYSKTYPSINQQDLTKDIKERMEMYTQIAECINYIKASSKSPRTYRVCGFDFEEAHQLLLDYNADPDSLKIDLDGSVWSPRNNPSSISCTIKPKSGNTTSRSKSISQKSKQSGDMKLPLRHQPEMKQIRPLKRIEEEQLSTINSPFSTSRRSKGPPEIKKTTAQVLREGARLQKKAVEAEKLIKDLCNGSMDPYISVKLLEEVREQENAMEVRDIERKHLLGLLSREEARIAKSAVLKANRMKALELKQQSQELEKQLQEWRHMEMIRMKEIAERNQSSMEQARLAQANLLDKRRKTAKQIQEESRELQRRIEQRKKQELEQKISLIRQIKELEHLSKSSTARDMGPNAGDNRSQTASIGVSCQMSIIQLKEALAQVKENIQQEIQQRREKIQFEHMRQQRLLQDTMRQIERYKNVPKRPKPKTLNQKELVLTPDLIKLRKKLELKRLQAASAGRF